MIHYTAQDLHATTGQVQVVLQGQLGSAARGVPCPEVPESRMIWVALPLETYLQTDRDRIPNLWQTTMPTGETVLVLELGTALKRLAHSDPLVLEVVQGPETQANFAELLPEARAFANRYFAQRPLMHYYTEQAAFLLQKATSQNEASAQYAELRVRACWYTLSARWLLEHQAQPPAQFTALLAQLEGQPNLQAALATLAQQAAGGPPINEAQQEALDAFLMPTLQTCLIAANNLPGGGVAKTHRLDTLFRQALVAVWGYRLPGV
jgi:predicted nucleotidyltransferase